MRTNHAPDALDDLSSIRPVNALAQFGTKHSLKDGAA